MGFENQFSFRPGRSGSPIGDFRSLLHREPRQTFGDHPLEDGARIAVIGGGPSGSLFSYFTLKKARMMGRDFSITIFEPKNFMKRGPAGCNHCGGVISELMVQSLAIEGINIPSNVVQRGINSYQLYTERGDVHIETPANEKTIASVYRAGGPGDLTVRDKESFDHFLLKTAVKEGAVHVQRSIERVALEDGKPALYSGGERLMEADLVVGAFGVNGKRTPVFDSMDLAYSNPATTRTAIAEIPLDQGYINATFGNSIHLFLLPVKNIKFAALIPKNSYVALCMIGKKIDRKRITEFLDHPKVRNLFPEGELEKPSCMCLPIMNIGAPSMPCADRLVMIGDAGSTRLYKDGIGAAYFTAKSASRTVVMYGVGKKDFQKHYMPDYKGLITDNRFGSVLFWFTDLFRVHGIMTSAMLRVVRRESPGTRGGRKVLSPILWDMFTGNERYKDIFMRALNPRLLYRMVTSVLGQLVGS